MNSIAKKPNEQSGLMQPWFQDFFDIENFFGRSLLPNGGSRASLPAVNISEDEQAFTIEVVAPGFQKEAFKVHVEDNVLSIGAETRQQEESSGVGKRYSRREYSYSSFTRSFQLPENIKAEEISAAYTDGVLRLQIPKEPQPLKTSKQIEIR